MRVIRRHSSHVDQPRRQRVGDVNPCVSHGSHLHFFVCFGDGNRPQYEFPSLAKGDQ